jgi:hypothetical protein
LAALVYAAGLNRSGSITVKGSATLSGRFFRLTNLSTMIKPMIAASIRQSGMASANIDALTSRAEAAGVNLSTAGFVNCALFTAASEPFHPARAGAN